MAISYSIASHASGYPSKVLAVNGGKHVYNIKISTAAGIDNGTFVGKGAFQSLDLYAEAAPTTVTGTIVGQAANGNWYVEIASTENALFVYTVPMIAEEFTQSFQLEGNFYNAKDDVARCYELAPGDIVEISAAGFVGTPAATKSVTLDTTKKNLLKVGA